MKIRDEVTTATELMYRLHEADYVYHCYKEQLQGRRTTIKVPLHYRDVENAFRRVVTGTIGRIGGVTAVKSPRGFWIGEWFVNTDMTECNPTAMQEIRPSLTESLKQELAKVETRAQELREMIGKLESNPQVQEVLDGLAKMGRVNAY
jgi:hypothetical protein